MTEAGVIAGRFGAVIQVVGAAHTFRPSLAVRRHLTKGLSAHHSSQQGALSYFFKGDIDSLAAHGQEMYLRTDPLTGRLARHWPEPELAVLLGERHEVLAVTLANDLTAVSVEARGRTAESDGTFLGKSWERSGSLGPRFVEPEAAGDISNLSIGLRVERGGRVIYDRSYSTSKSLYPLGVIPDLVAARRREYGDSPPPSKHVELGPDGFLRPGTVLMFGAGLITYPKYYCAAGDVLSVYCPSIGTLTNTLVAAGAAAGRAGARLAGTP